MPIPPILVFSKGDNLIYLEDRSSARALFSFPAHNRTENPSGDPLQLGSGAPAPAGLLVLSPPDFISEEFRERFYRENFDNKNALPGESLVQHWGEYEEKEMGRVRFALGSRWAPPGSANRAAWDRELLIHAGKSFEMPTRGCIRMRNDDMEKFACRWIEYYKKGIHLNKIHVR